LVSIISGFVIQSRMKLKRELMLKKSRNENLP
jgi:hypothetical protein